MGLSQERYIISLKQVLVAKTGFSSQKLMVKHSVQNINSAVNCGFLFETLFW